MLKKLLPVLLVVVGSAAGGYAGLAMRPEPEPTLEEDQVETAQEEVEEVPEEESDEREYVELSNQFVIPLVERGDVTALVVMSLSLEAMPGNTEAILAKEPKLRDSFLQVLFDHANLGGFKGAFTELSTLEVLRTALRKVAKDDLGEAVTDVLILEFARQDV